MQLEGWPALAPWWGAAPCGSAPLSIAEPSRRNSQHFVCKGLRSFGTMLGRRRYLLSILEFIVGAMVRELHLMFQDLCASVRNAERSRVGVFVPDPGNGQVVVRRRRPTRRHRRNRFVRRCLLLTVVGVFVAGIFAAALRYFGPALFHGQQLAAHALHYEIHHGPPAELNQILLQSQMSRPIYPYSVVPGGVESVKELKWAADHDPVVAAHYAGFDYERAHIVQLTLARTEYVSYRIGNHIYWTSHRITLHKGEKLITDGRMTARTRCANRVEETPQQKSAAKNEPTQQQLEQPLRGQGTAMQAPPVTFQSALLNRPQTPDLGATGPLSLYDPFVGGNFIAISVPPLPEGVCEPVPKKPGKAGEISAETGKKKPAPGPCGPGSMGTVPEPGTWALFATGLAMIAWRFRRTWLPVGARG